MSTWLPKAGFIVDLSLLLAWFWALFEMDWPSRQRVTNRTGISLP